MLKSNSINKNSELPFLSVIFIKGCNINMDILLLVIKFAFIPLFIVTVYCLFIYRKLTKELRTLAWFIFFSAGIELFSRIWWFQSMNNMPFLHLYVAGGFCFLANFYQEVLRGLINPKIIWITVGGFLALTIFNSLFLQDIYTFNSNALTVESILIIIFSLSTYTIMHNDNVKKNKLHLFKSLNWINSGLFIYYSSSLLIFYFGDIITHLFSKEASLYTWVIHAFFSMMMYGCFFAGLWHRPTN
ncbi:MAG: hypothetical protein HYZ44_11290 [Bacteroidetes bacterium]|nr:hypothetical protein [Bacteroidota bacterium]